MRRTTSLRCSLPLFWCLVPVVRSLSLITQPNTNWASSLSKLFQPSYQDLFVARFLTMHASLVLISVLAMLRATSTVTGAPLPSDLVKDIISHPNVLESSPASNAPWMSGIGQDIRKASVHLRSVVNQYSFPIRYSGQPFKGWW